MAAGDGEPKKVSVLFRFRRSLCEQTFVKVPVTEDLFVDGKLDFERMAAAGARLAASSRWIPDDDPVVIEPHPIQKPLPDDWRWES